VNPNAAIVKRKNMGLPISVLNRDVSDLHLSDLSAISWLVVSGRTLAWLQIIGSKWLFAANPLFIG